MKSLGPLLILFVVLTGSTIIGTNLVHINNNILIARGGENQIELEWKCSDEKATSLVIYRERETEQSSIVHKITEVQNPPAEIYTDTNLPADTKYKYKVMKVVDGIEKDFGEIEASTNKSNPTEINISFNQNDINGDFNKLILNIIDQNMNPIKNLAPSNFEILQDGEEKKVFKVETIENRVGLSGSILMDYSSSIIDEDLRLIEKMVKDFINQKNYYDDFEIIKFSTEVRNVSYFKSNKDELKKTIDSPFEREGTSLFKALYKAIINTSLRPSKNNKKFLIALTDGNDTTSEEFYSKERIIQLAKNLSIPIYIVAFGNDINYDIMQEIASNTNGQVFQSDIKSTGIYDRLLDFLKSTYVIEIDSLKKQQNMQFDVKVKYNSIVGEQKINITEYKRPYYSPIIEFINNKNDYEEVKRFYADDKGGFIPIPKELSMETDTDIDVSSLIILNFDKEVDENILKNSITIELIPNKKQKINNNSNLTIDFDIEKINNKTFVIKPITKFEYFTEHHSLYYGIKPNKIYKVTLKKSQLATYSGSNDYVWDFKTKNFDFGLYWFGDDNKCEKYVTNRPNKYYNNNNTKTIIYAHGWKNESVKKDDYIATNIHSDYIRECFIWGYEHNQNHNASNNIVVNDVSEQWRKDGWNTGIFQWNQFADDSKTMTEPEKAEAKIWKGYNKQGTFVNSNMRFRYIDDNNELKFSEDFPVDKSVAELFKNIYIDALSDKHNDEIRLAGHSLGNQLVTHTAWLLKEECSKMQGKLNHIMPNRLALIDPYWSGGNKDYLVDISSNYLGGETIADRSRLCLIDLNNYYYNEGKYLNSDNGLKTKDFVIEQYKTSDLSGNILGFFGGDNNNELREYVCFSIINLNYVDNDYRGFANQLFGQLHVEEAQKHCIAPKYYFESYKHIFRSSNHNILAPSAREPNGSLKKIINFGSPSRQNIIFTQVEGKETIRLDDDVFEVSFDQQ